MPDAQHAPKCAQSAVSKLVVSNVCQVRPRSAVKSLPVGPTSTAMRPTTHVAPDLYSLGASSASCQLTPPSSVQAAPSGELLGARKSPPTAMPCTGSLNASAKI